MNVKNSILFREKKFRVAISEGDILPYDAGVDPLLGCRTLVSVINEISK